MLNKTMLTFTTAALLATGSALAGPNCKKNSSPGEGEGVYEVSAEGKEGKCQKKERSEGEGVYEVAEREGADRERPERGDKPKRGERPKPFTGLDLSDDQKEQVKEIMTSAREQAEEIFEAAKEDGEKPDREELMAIHKEAFKNVYDNVLNDDQRAKVDERRKKMEEKRKERGDREGRDGEKRERPSRGGDEGLDL